MTQNFREGDQVLVEAVVLDAWGDDPDLRLRVGVDQIYVKRTAVRLGAPIIKPGDAVRLKAKMLDGHVLAVALDHVWVEIDAGQFATWWIPNVERIAIASDGSKGGDA
jgi:hypothetical protein